MGAPALHGLGRRGSAAAVERRDEARARAARRPRFLLALGALAGLALAGVELVRPSSHEVPLSGDTIAVVNGHPVARPDFESAVSALAADRRSAIDATDRRRILDRLIEEQLLVERGIDLDLPRRDPRVRAEVVAAVIDTISSEASAREPSAAEVARFYAENGDLFAEPGRIRARQVLVRVAPGETEESARARAEAAAERLRAGEEHAAVVAALGDTPIAPLPDALLPPQKLREYLGPTVARAALELEPGRVGDPVRSSLGYHVLEALERERGRLAPLEEIESQVRAEWRRRKADQALREYLDDLRSRAQVTTAPGLP